MRTLPRTLPAMSSPLPPYNMNDATTSVVQEDDARQAPEERTRTIVGSGNPEDEFFQPESRNGEIPKQGRRSAPPLVIHKHDPPRARERHRCPKVWGACAALSPAPVPIVDIGAIRLESPLIATSCARPVDLNFGARPRYPKLNVGLPVRDNITGWTGRGYVPDARHRRTVCFSAGSSRAAVGIEQRYDLSLTRGLRLQLLFGELLLRMHLAVVMPMMPTMVLRLRRGFGCGRRGFGCRRRGFGRGRSWRCRFRRLLRNTDTEPAAHQHECRASD
jgi:hypothetical protein